MSDELYETPQASIVSANHAKLLYVLERVRARSANSDVFHTHGEGSDCHAECVQLEADGLIDDTSNETDKVLHGRWQWTVVA